MKVNQVTVQCILEYHQIHLIQLVHIHFIKTIKIFHIKRDGVIYHNSKYFNINENGIYKTNDIIKLTINPFTSQISFPKNDILIICEGYNAQSQNKYKLAISLFHERVSIINKNNICEGTQPQNKLEHRLIENNNGSTSQINELEQQLSLIKQANRQLVFENELLMTQNKPLTNYCLKECNYIGVPEVIQWNVSLENGKYLKYYEMLNIKITDAELIGKKLKELDYVDIKQDLGIIDIDDRKSLYRNEVSDCETMQRINNCLKREAICVSITEKMMWKVFTKLHVEEDKQQAKTERKRRRKDSEN